MILRLSDPIWAFLGLNEMNRFEWSQLGNIWNISIQVHWRNWWAAGSQVLKRGDQATCSRNVPMKGVQELYSKTHVQQTNKLLDKCFKKELFKNRAASMQWKIVFSEHRTKICCKNGVYIIKCRPEKSPRHIQYMCATIKKTLRHSIAGLYPDCSHHRCKGFGLPQKFSRKPQTPHVDQVRWTLRSLQPIQLIVARPCTCLECLEHLLWRVRPTDHNVEEAGRLKCTKNVRNWGALDFHKIWIHQLYAVWAFHQSAIFRQLHSISPLGIRTWSLVNFSSMKPGFAATSWTKCCFAAWQKLF